MHTSTYQFKASQGSTCVFRSVLAIQSTAFWSVHRNHGVPGSGEGGHTDCLTKGYKNPPVPRRLVCQIQIPPNLSPAYTLLALCQKLGCSINSEKSKLYPKQVLDIVGYQFDMKEDKVRSTLECWQTLNTKIQKHISGPTCSVLQLMFLIGLLTAMEKQVHLGRLHMRLQEEMFFKANHYTPSIMVCKSLQTHQKKSGTLT